MQSTLELIKIYYRWIIYLQRSSLFPVIRFQLSYCGQGGFSGDFYRITIFIAPVHFLRNISLCRIASPEGGSNDDDACDRESFPRIPKYWRVHLLFITGVYSDPSLLVIECIWRVLLLLLYYSGCRATGLWPYCCINITRHYREHHHQGRGFARTKVESVIKGI